MPTPCTTNRLRRTEPVIATLLAAAGTLLAACAGTGDGHAGALDWNVEFAVARRGGLCVTADEAGEQCGLTIVVRDDGTWRAEGTMPPAPAEGAVAEGAASRLASIIDEGWDALTARPFTGTCPIAYDGQETVYMVRRIPTGPGAELADAAVREVGSCTYDLDHADARAVLQRLDETWRQLGLPGLGFLADPSGG